MSDPVSQARSVRCPRATGRGRAEVDRWLGRWFAGLWLLLDCLSARILRRLRPLLLVIDSRRVAWDNR
jgi:hypothetical protein